MDTSVEEGHIRSDFTLSPPRPRRAARTRVLVIKRQFTGTPFFNGIVRTHGDNGDDTSAGTSLPRVRRRRALSTLFPTRRDAVVCDTTGDDASSSRSPRVGETRRKRRTHITRRDENTTNLLRRRVARRSRFVPRVSREAAN